MQPVKIHIDPFTSELKTKKKISFLTLKKIKAMELNLYAFIYSMRILGLLPTASITTLAHSRRPPIQCFVYPFLILILVWINFIRVFIFYWFVRKGNNDLPDYLVRFLSFGFQFTSCYCRTNMFIKNWRNCLFKAINASILHSDSKFWKNFPNFEVSMNRRKDVARIQFVILSISWATPIIGGLINIVRSIASPNRDDGGLIVPLEGLIPNGISYILVSMLVTVSTLATDCTMTFVVGFVATVDLQTGLQFVELANWLRQRFEKLEQCEQVDIDQVQTAFFSLTKVLRRLDKVVRSQLGVIILFSFYGVLVNLYRFEWSPPKERWSLFPQFAFCIGLLLFSTIPSIVVNNVSGRTLDQLKLFSFTNFTGSDNFYKLSLLILFEERQSLEPAALSLFRLQYIRNGTLLAVSFQSNVTLPVHPLTFDIILSGLCFDHNFLFDNDGFYFN